MLYVIANETGSTVTCYFIKRKRNAFFMDGVGRRFIGDNLTFCQARIGEFLLPH